MKNFELWKVFNMAFLDRNIYILHDRHLADTKNDFPRWQIKNILRWHTLNMLTDKINLVVNGYEAEH